MSDQTPLRIWWNKNLEGRISAGQLAAHAAHAALEAYGIPHEHPIMVLRAGKRTIERMPIRLHDSEGHANLDPDTITVGVRDMSRIHEQDRHDAALVEEVLTMAEDLLFPTDESAARAVRVLREDIDGLINSGARPSHAIEVVAAHLADVETQASAQTEQVEGALDDPLAELEAQKLAGETLLVLRGKLNKAAPAARRTVERAIYLRGRMDPVKTDKGEA